MSRRWATFSRSEKKPRPVRDRLKLSATHAHRRKHANAKKNTGRFVSEAKFSLPNLGGVSIEPVVP